jgi:hypothetical protein
MSAKIKTIIINEEDIAFLFSEIPDDFATSHCFCVQCRNGNVIKLRGVRLSLSKLE